jgi:hypothetical protein
LVDFGNGELLEENENLIGIDRERKLLDENLIGRDRDRKLLEENLR